MTIAAVVLAAGRSTRFAVANKLLAPIKGEPLVRQVLLQLSKAPVGDIILVVNPASADVIAAAGEGPWRTILNPEADEGMAASIRHGIAALEPDCQGAMIVPGDMPLITSSLIAQVISEFRAYGQTHIACPQSPSGQRGHPVIWPSAYFTRLKSLRGDSGGKKLIEAASDLVTVRVDDDSAFFDIDTQDDLEAFRTRLR